MSRRRRMRDCNQGREGGRRWRREEAKLEVAVDRASPSKVPASLGREIDSAKIAFANQKKKLPLSLREEDRGGRALPRDLPPRRAMHAGDICDSLLELGARGGRR